jgi:hypothetical protein
MNQNQLVHIRGDSGSFEVTLTDTNGDPLDLTGASVQFTVDGLLDKSLGDGITVQVTLSDGTVRTPIRGLFVLVPDVTTD